MKKIALVGNPNTGKTTLFNSILKTNEHVGNWHGVTVEFKEKLLKQNGKEVAVITDLPGTYSLSSFSFEEAVTRDYLLKNKDLTIVNIVDGNCIKKNLILTLELIEMGFCPILCINMANELKKKNEYIDTKKLEQELGIKVFLLNAQNRKEVKSMFDWILTNNTENTHKTLPYVDMLIHKFDTKYQKIINDFKDKKHTNIFSNFDKIKLLELDERLWDKFSNSNEVNNAKQIFENDETIQFVLKTRYDFIESLNIVSKTKRIYGYHKIDKIFLNRFFAIPIFAVIVGVIFFFTFGPVGTIFTDWFSNLYELYVFNPIANFIGSITNNLFVQNFFVEAVLGSIGAIISFLPQIVLMYLGLYLLEDSGYMSRIAFVFEDYLKKVGLSGKSVFTILMSFGCSTTATLTSRNLENKNNKIKTALLTPYMSCTAKLPIYAVVASAFFPNHKFLVVISFYLLGILIAMLVSYVLNKKVLKSSEENFVLEMPPYRVPSIKKIVKNVFQNIKEFLLRAGSILLVFSCIVWILQNCNIKLQYNQDDSILSVISKLIYPIFVPLGFESYGVVTALLCGFVAKEIIVSTIGILNGHGGESIDKIATSIVSAGSVFYLTKASAISFLVFATLYIPCVSTISVLVKEIGKKWTALGVAIQFLLSYAVAFVAYRIVNYFLIHGFWSGVVSLICFAIIMVIIFEIYSIFKKKNFCKFCPKNKSCNK